VPYLRGPERHRSPEAILRDVTHLAARGVSEITLVGQNVNSYSRDGLDFAALIRRVAAENRRPPNPFHHLSSQDLSDSLIRLFGEEPKLMGHVHLPLQSGSDGSWPSCPGDIRWIIIVAGWNSCGRNGPISP